MINTKKYKLILIAVLISVLFISAALYGLSRLADYYYTNECAAALGDWQREFPNAFSMIEKKFGNDLEVTDAKRWGLNITYKCSTEFENKYNINNKPTEEFLQDIADEWFECFHDEIADKLKNHDEYFDWPVSIGFRFEKGSEYELIVFSYEDLDKCNVFRYEKW